MRYGYSGCPENFGSPGFYLVIRQNSLFAPRLDILPHLRIMKIPKCTKYSGVSMICLIPVSIIIWSFLRNYKIIEIF